MWQWQVTEFEAGHRLLDALHLRVPAAPRAFLHQTIRKGRIHWEHHPADADMRLDIGMRLEVHTSTRFMELSAQSGIFPQDVLYEDRHMLVVFKPAGLPVHCAVGHGDSLLERSARYVALRHAPYRLAPAHRLDIGTSGPVMFGKGRWATGQLGRALMAGQIDKRYWAVVTGKVSGQGQLTTPVVEGRQIKSALTRFQCLSGSGSCHLLELELVTGRRHQARQQLATAGWPILGDRRYGGPPWPGLDQLFLHCHHLSFPSLVDGRRRQVECPLPPVLAKILTDSGLSDGVAITAKPEFFADDCAD